MNKREQILLGLDEHGNIVWDLPTFIYQNNEDKFDINYEHEDFVKKRGSLFFNTIQRLKQYDIYRFKKKTIDLFSNENVSIEGTDEEIKWFRQTLDIIFEEGLNEISCYHFISHINNVIDEMIANDHIFIITENTYHYSDDWSWSGFDKHTSYVAVRKMKTEFEETYYRIQLIPMSSYARMVFFVNKDNLDSALALIVAYFMSAIRNKRQRLLISKLFDYVGITGCKTVYDV